MRARCSDCFEILGTDDSSFLCSPPFAQSRFRIANSIVQLFQVRFRSRIAKRVTDKNNPASLWLFGMLTISGYIEDATLKHSITEKRDAETQRFGETRR